MIKNEALSRWVEEVKALCEPDQVVVCDGSEAERDRLIELSLRDGSLLQVNPATYPNSYFHRSSPTDVARTEHLTFICCEKKDDAGPTNNWMAPDDARAKLTPLFKGAMKGRTMYVVPYLMGPVGSPSSRVGVEITDSAYVVLNMRVMTRMGAVAVDALGDRADFVRGLHSTGDLSPERRFICHFPETRTIWSIGSGYGGNALLGKKCHALRIASAQGRAEGWMAEHMLILGLTSPAGETHYIAAAFPSACGKTNLAMMVPSLPGWKVTTVGDDIAWLRVGDDGRLWAINPEAGMFGVAPGTGSKTNPNAMASVKHDAIFTNVALTPSNEPWWEGMDGDPPETATDWQGRPWTRGSGEKAAHPNSRFTVPAKNCPSVTADIDAPSGVPISAIIFGGRRAKAAPLVFESLDWQHGVFVGATMVSETTAAATGAVGVPRNDPMAMLPFCGYNMGDYFGHWLAMGKKASNPPKVFHVNWFRTGPDGKFLWPGFGDNVRVLKWITDRIAGRAEAKRTPVGLVPTPSSLDLSGLGIGDEKLPHLLDVDAATWKAELELQRAFLTKFGDRLPKELWSEHAALEQRLSS
ncbi:MAG: phosphoenolpyruvate carboxykinase (GTP) [Polyangiaceae bacterium]|nr:phosphoenolpyruvate carboxykinase (GTP) [Polyangiaceae bacterium]